MSRLPVNQSTDGNRCEIGHDARARLRKLAARGRREQAQEFASLDWNRPARPPYWFPRRSCAKLVADLRFGELATAEACEYLAAALPNSNFSDCLAIQREDERRHAAFYQRYLDALGVEAQPDPALAAIHRRCLDWNGDPVAVVLAINVVLEGEALRMQRFFAERFPCPLFADMNRAILADEARHVASGRIYAASAMTGLDSEQRAMILAWLHGLWWDCAGAVRARFGGVQGRLIRALMPPLSVAWQAQANALAQLGLPSSPEFAARSQSTWPLTASLS